MWKPMLDRRALLVSGAAAGVASVAGPRSSLAEPAAALLKVETRMLEVRGKAAKAYAVLGPGGRHGIMAAEGDRFRGALLNASDEPLQMHWHGQTLAPFDQDRARPDGGTLAIGAADQHDFALTPGTHWMHSHSLSEQQLLAAPMVTRERDAGDVQDVIVMLHDFAWRTPQEILAELGGSDVHAGHGGQGGSTPGAAAEKGGSHAGHGGSHSGGHGGSHDGGGGARSGGSQSGHSGHAGHGHAGHGHGMAHANDVRYDAYLANERSIEDPATVRVDKGSRVRLRIINGGTATAFHVATPGLASRCIAVDGTPCRPLAAERYPLAQGQRIDLLVTIPTGGGAFPVLAQVEEAQAVAAVILATPGARVAKLAAAAAKAAPLVDLGFEGRLAAVAPLAPRPADKAFTLVLGEEPGYRWTINGAIHGEHTPLDVGRGERVEITFANPTSMMHPMHLHGHHFQVVAIGGRRYAGPVRDTVIVPPHTPVTIAVDANVPGAWYLHCHHLYHMATGMMTEMRVA